VKDQKNPKTCAIPIENMRRRSSRGILFYWDYLVLLGIIIIFIAPVGMMSEII
jgi:hypothetical protein